MTYLNYEDRNSTNISLSFFFWKLVLFWKAKQFYCMCRNSAYVHWTVHAKRIVSKDNIVLYLHILHKSLRLYLFRFCCWVLFHFVFKSEMQYSYGSADNSFSGLWNREPTLVCLRSWGQSDWQNALQFWRNSMCLIELGWGKDQLSIPCTEVTVNVANPRRKATVASWVEVSFLNHLNT